jgi:hypothetical protein
MTDPEQQAALSGRGRWALALGAVVALVVAFVVLRGGSGDDSAGQPASTQLAQTQAQNQTQTQTGTQAQEQEQEQEPSEPSEPAKPAVPTIRVRAGQPVGGLAKLEFRKGDRIRFRVTADQPDDVHLHGYDIEKGVGPGRLARFDVEATIEGRFEVELHHSGAQIARVDVSP